MSPDLLDPFGASSTLAPVGAGRADPWPVGAALGLAGLGAVAGAAQILDVARRSAGLSVAVYVVVLLGGSALLGRYRFAEGSRSRRPGYVRRPGAERWAVAAAVAIVLACALTGFVASTEWSKG